MASNEGWPLANNQQGTLALSPTVLEELNPASSHMSLEEDIFPVEPSGETTSCFSLVRDPEVEDSANPYLVS